MLSITRVFKIVMRVAEWATPKVKEWHRERNLNRSEARRHLQSRNWSEAEKHFQLALEERQRSTVDRLELLLGLAEAQRGQSKLDLAEETACQAVTIAVQEKNESMHSLALETLANVHLDQGRFGDAEKVAHEVIRLETTRAKPDHARLASCCRKLASALEQTDRPVEAIEARKHGASHAEKAFGPDHAETAAHLSELGTLHRRHGHHSAAQGCLRRVLEIHRSGETADSKEATQALYNLAASLEEAGNPDGAAAEYQKLLALRERQVGAKPEETADAQVRLATLHLRAGRLPAAREMLMLAVPALERKGGPALAQALETLASAEEQSGRTELARQYRERALYAASLHVAGES